MCSSFVAYEKLPRTRPLAAAGGAVVMDYRLWHRGLANRANKAGVAAKQAPCAGERNAPVAAAAAPEAATGTPSDLRIEANDRPLLYFKYQRRTRLPGVHCGSRSCSVCAALGQSAGGRSPLAVADAGAGATPPRAAVVATGATTSPAAIAAGSKSNGNKRRRITPTLLTPVSPAVPSPARCSTLNTYT